MKGLSLKSLIKKAKEEPKPLITNGASASDVPAVPMPDLSDCKVDFGALNGSSKVENLNDSKIYEDVYVVRNWLTVEAENALLHNLLAHSKSEFVHLKSGKRTASFGGKISPEGFFEEKNIPKYLYELMEPLQGSFQRERAPNHLFVNDYDAGIGIMPHFDGPMYDNVVAIVSLDSGVVFDLFKPDALKNPAPRDVSTTANALVSFYLPPRSLLVFTGAAYDSLMHGIDFRTRDSVKNVINPQHVPADVLEAGELQRGHRVSLTIRHARFQQREGTKIGA